MLQDKVGTAKKIDSLLSKIIASGDFRLKYRITVNPPPPPGGVDGEQPEILVELAGPDSSLLLERGAEVLAAPDCKSGERASPTNLLLLKATMVLFCSSRP